jgi:hypothetical protein
MWVRWRVPRKSRFTIFLLYENGKEERVRSKEWREQKGWMIARKGLQRWQNALH